MILKYRSIVTLSKHIPSVSAIPLSCMKRSRVVIKHPAVLCRSTFCHQTTTINFLFSYKTVSQFDKEESVKSKSLPTKLKKMSSVSVRNCEGDNYLQIAIDMEMNEHSNSVKSFNLNRQKTELLGVTLARFHTSLLSKLVSRKKKKVKPKSTEDQTKVEESGESTSTSSPGSEESAVIPIEILHNGEPVEVSMPNCDAWVQGAVLKVGSKEIEVNVNLPSAKLNKLPSVMLAEFPIFADLVNIEFTNHKQCELYWRTVTSKDLNKVNHLLAREGSVDLSDMVKSPHFTPQQEHLGHHVMVVCVPKNGERLGKHSGLISKRTVTSGPGPCPFEKRHLYTKSFAEGERFRVLTYNILAKIYSGTEEAKNHLFRHCPPQFLEMDYRKHLFLKEILGYKSDILCLQEVDKSIFQSHLTPALHTVGYAGLFLPKDGTVSEGCACFVRLEKFSIVQRLDIALSEFLKMDPACSDIWEQVCQVEPLRKKIEERSSILQVVVLQEVNNPDRVVCLANTHLYFHPTGCNIRLIHAATALRHLQNVISTYRHMGKQVALVFCGDFNSAPHLGIYQLMTAQFVPTDHADWSSAGEEERLPDLELSQPMNIESACGTPEYTNFTVGFRATLDYIYIDSDQLRVCSTVPLPAHEEITRHTALPNVVFPSDHLALVCDLEFKTEK